MKLNFNIIRSFKYNLLLKYLNYTLVLIGGFVLIPFYLKNFSLELYGSWIIISAIISWFLMIDPGSGSLLIQQISMKIGKKKLKDISGIIFSGIINSLIISLIILLIGNILGIYLVIWFIETPEVINEIKIAFKYAVFAAAITLFAQTFVYTIEGLQKTFVAGLIIFSASLIKIISVVVLINLNFGIKSLPLSDLISGLTMLILTFSYILINFSIFYIKKFNLKLGVYKKYTSLFFYNFAGRFSKFLTGGGIDSFLIAKIIGLESVTTYYLTQLVPKKMEAFMGVTVSSARPSLAYLSGSLSKQNLAKLKLKMLYVIFLLFTFVIYFLYDIIEPFLELWIGENIYPGFYIVFFIVVLSSQRILTHFLSVILYSQGKIKEVSKIQIIYTVVLIPFLILGTQFYNLSGLVTAHIIILFLTLTLFLFKMILQDPNFLKSYKSTLIKEIIFLILTTIISLLIYKIFIQFINIEKINWLILISLLFIKGSLFITILYFISVNFKNELLYFLKNRKFLPLNKWEV